MNKLELKKEVEAISTALYELERKLPDWKNNHSFAADARYRLFLVRVELGAVINFVSMNGDRTDYRRKEKQEAREES